MRNMPRLKVKAVEHSELIVSIVSGFLGTQQDLGCLQIFLFLFLKYFTVCLFFTAFCSF